MKYLITIFTIMLPFITSCQDNVRQQKLRISITPERAWWDLLHYDLNVEVRPDLQYISGTNTILYKVLTSSSDMQIDLQSPMKINKITQGGHELEIISEGNAHFIKLKEEQEVGSESSLTIHFSGKPRVAVKPPWDGGFSWEKDSNGNHFIATSNQGIGASVWWPNKDHPYDEPDHGVDVTITTDRDLVAVSNGRLIKETDNGLTKSWHWKVVNPINNYGVNINIGDYIHFGEQYQGEKGTLDMDYYVLRDNLMKAREQFKQAVMMMEAFEHWFGPYPFYEDSFKLVEVPYLGMEHQSSVTYGNKYKNGYLGSDMSGTGWGLKFDFIIIHESGHEWFANNITKNNFTDMWIQEGFTAYSENLYLDYHYGKEASADYVIGTRTSITNKRPIIGEYSVDMYVKGANILHTLRQLIEDDEKWRSVLRSLNEHFYHQTISSKQLEDHMSELTGIDLTEFFDQYLRTTKIPKLECQIVGNSIRYRYVNIIDNFDMPVIVMVNDEPEWIYPNKTWKTNEYPDVVRTVQVKRDFYIESEILTRNRK
jgi:aminopeptidase N